MIKHFMTCLCLLFCIATTSFGQQKNYEAVDKKVATFGALPAFNVAVIADTITRPFAAKEDKARAIFYWIAQNIAVDVKAVKTNSQKDKDPENVVKLRKGTALGFSLLFQEMCSLVNIRCLSIDGYLKSFPEEIGIKADEVNHSWNVVQLGESPEKWFYVDAMRATGFTDKKYTLFTKEFTAQYFFADRLLFNLDHYPDNTAWQLGAGPKSVKDFFELPVISNASYQYGVQKPVPDNGIIKTKINKAVVFSVPYNGAKLVSVDMLIGDARKQKKPEHMNFTQSNNTIAFSYTFKEEDEFPIRIMADGKELLAYQVIIKEK